MSVENLTSAGVQKMEALEKKVKEAVAFYRKLQTISLTETIIEIGDDVDIATEYLVPKLPNETLRIWKKRASKIEKVNEALQDFEFGIVDELTLNNAAIWVTEIHKVFQKFEWLLGHLGEISLLLATTFGYIQGKYGKEIWRGTKDVWWALLKGDFDKATDVLADLASSEGEILNIIMQTAVLSLLAEMLEPVIAAFSAEAYGEAIAPVLAVKAASEKALQAQAWPQGTGRVRRRKRQRMRVA